MPKILINEKDKTSPGTSPSYANYSVLIVGFAGEPEAATADDKETADSNGVYEFSSADQFRKTIGLRAPEVSTGAVTCKHYGNQMAYELLNMGYTIIWKTIDSIQDLKDAEFWGIFKDKASYDFRFITHGLLSSNKVDSSRRDSLKTALDLLYEALAKISVNSTGDSYDELSAEAKAEKLLEITNEAEQDNFNIDEYLEKAFPKADLRFNAVKEYYDGILADTDSDLAGFTPIDGTTPYADFAAAFKGVKSEYKTLEENIVNFVVEESTITDVNCAIADLAKYSKSGTAENDMYYSEDIPGRGDCTALIEIDENSYNNSTGVVYKPETKIIEAITNMSSFSGNEERGKFCALTVPSVTYKMTPDKKFNGNKTFPGAFHYLACFMSSLNKGFAEWYAAAGYTRGTSGYTIDSTTVKLGELAINALEPRKQYDGGPKFACNVIANFRGSYYLWGNRTACNLRTDDLVASHFLNIRQLCSTIKKQLYVSCRKFTFDPNSDVLWINFCNAIRPTLETMKADQGIKDYRIIKVAEDRKAMLKAKIRIIPIEAVEDFDLEVSLHDSFGEVSVEV